MRRQSALRPVGCLLALALLVGCSGEPETMRAEDTVFGTQVKAHNTAKAMNDMVLESHAERDEELRREGG